MMAMLAVIARHFRFFERCIRETIALNCAVPTFVAHAETVATQHRKCLGQVTQAMAYAIGH